MKEKIKKKIKNKSEMKLKHILKKQKKRQKQNNEKQWKAMQNQLFQFVQMNRAGCQVASR